MAREIKFRGKALNGDKNWVYGGILPEYRGAVHIIPTFGCFVAVDPDTVGQATGVRDANGQEMYEGDVIEGQFKLRTSDQEYRVAGSVEYDDQMFCIQDEASGEAYSLNRIRNIRVVGTIHDANH